MRLRITKDLNEYTIAASNADVGRVHDFYFDDEKWTIRYIVVATGDILSGRKVLISPLCLRDNAWGALHLLVNLTWEQIESGPGIDLHKPVSRQHEAEHHKHLGLPAYWGGPDVWGAWPSPQALAAASLSGVAPAGEPVNASEDVHLRSCREVSGYHIKAVDGEIGHLEDFLFDEETWEIRYAIVDTKNWWPGKKILLRPQWIDRVSWTEREIYTNLSRDTIQKSPAWNPDEPVSREYELRLHGYYGYEPYWTSESRRVNRH